MKGTVWIAAMMLTAPIATHSQNPAPVSAAESAGKAPAREAQSPTALDRPVTLDVSRQPLGVVLEEIARQAKLDLEYTDEAVPVKTLVSITVRGVTAREALRVVLRGLSVTVRELPTGSVALVKQQPERQSDSGEGQQSGNVYGVVTDSASGEPVENVLVRVKETNLRASTNERGQYRIDNVPSGVQVITTRLLGYQPIEKEVTVTDDRTVRADFALRHGLTRLQEVVTTATGRQRRMELGNDITVIDADSIVRTQPITSVTDLLETRVPGLTVQRTSGAPGDPARIRVRGASSFLLNNDPIVIVDGIRVYGAQSDTARGSNLAGRGFTSGPILEGYAAPSPLDYIDPHSIETLEVIKGPSAATLYGQDAANGVIVITTKKGREGPPRWTVSTDRGMTKMAGSYPDLLVRWGHRDTDNLLVVCPIVPSTLVQACHGDSVTKFQLLNDPELTVLDQGSRTSAALGVSGGSSTLTYALNGSYQDEIGLLVLPAFEVERYRLNEGTSPPDWMERPQNFTKWSATSRLTAELGPRADVSLTSQLSRLRQQRSSLQGQLTNLMTTFLDRSTGTYIFIGGVSGIGILNDPVLTNYYERARATATSFTNAIEANWRPRGWLTATANAGLNVIQRADDVFLPRGLAAGTDSVGEFSIGQGTTLVSTVNMRADARAPVGRGFQLRFATGVNYTAQSIADFGGKVRDLAAGTGSVDRGAVIVDLDERRTDQATYGWYVEPSISHKRQWLSMGLRLDGGSTFGSNIKLPSFPKLSYSYLISDEPFFPWKSLIPLLRLRVAYGHAGQQPGPADRLRLYNSLSRTWVDGRFADAVELQTLGNTELRPERSREFEGGFDADLFDDRLTLGLTGYRKTRIDAIMPFRLPPSLFGPNMSILRNFGVVRNVGLDLTVGTQLLRTDAVKWGTQVSISRHRSIVLEVAPSIFGMTTLKAEYPLNGNWAKPILGYADMNGNGVLDPGEILIGGTEVFMGAIEPNYDASLHTTLSLLRGAVSITAGLTYQDGMTQRNGPLRDLAPFSRAVNDPQTPFSEQAFACGTPGTDYGCIQTVSTLRFNSLSVRYNWPSALARRLLRARSAALSLQGTNLALKTNYSGLDPNVNSSVTGNGLLDNGVLPQPRTWQLRVDATY